MDAKQIDTPRQVGICVRRAREAQGLTRAQLAEKAGVSERLLASLELGDATGIRLDKLLGVLSALGLFLVVQGEAIAQDPEPRRAPASSRPHAMPDPLEPSAVRQPPLPKRRGKGRRKGAGDEERAGLLRPSVTYDSLLAGVAADMGIHLAQQA